MAKAKPFKALRFNDKLINDPLQVICPVYDIIDEKKYTYYINKSPYNIVRLESPRGYDRYNNAKNILDSLINQKVLVKENKDSIYIYEQEFIFDGKKKKLHGIICLIKVENFDKQVIFPHEHTLCAPKNDRLNLLKTTKSNFSPIFSLYDDKDNSTEKKLIPFMKSPPKLEFTDENNVTHRLWIVDNENSIKEICDDFNSRKLYIADGHHRYETAQKFKALTGNNYTMMFLANMNDENLIILPTHRLIKACKDFNFNTFFNNCTQYFNVNLLPNKNELQKSLNKVCMCNKHGFGMYFKGNYFILVLKEDISLKKVPLECDVSILDELIIKRSLKKDLSNINNQKDIFYTRDFSYSIDLVNKNEYDIAFFLNPTPLSQIINVANANEKMPQKSTYFITKVIAGLTIYKMD